VIQAPITTQPANQPQTNKQQPMNDLTRSSAKAHNLKTRFLSQPYLGLGLLIAAFAVLPFSTIADQQIAISGNEIYVDSTPISFVFPIASNLTTAEGKATHLGHYTIVGVTTIDATTATATGVFRMTTEDGDILFLTMTGYALQPFSVKETVADFTVTGGTGHFAGATGGWRLTSHFVYPVDSGEPSNPYVGEISGMISRATHGNRGDD
jgi:hypothetical protein